jgi:hypothetical protein
MEAMFDFKNWLDHVDTDSFDEVHSLYNAVLNNEGWGSFSCTERETSKGTQYIVQGDDIEAPLILTTNRKFFLEYLNEKYGGDLGIQGEYAFRESMRKDS